MKIELIKINDKGLRLPKSAKSWIAVELPEHGLMFDANDSTAETVKFLDARKKCKALRLAGFKNWRSPEDHELFLLRDSSRYNPAINTDYFKSCKAEPYWTNTPDASAPEDGAWVVNFYYGNVNFGYQNHRFRVRAVRSVVPAGQ